MASNLSEGVRAAPSTMTLPASPAPRPDIRMPGSADECSLGQDVRHAVPEVVDPGAMARRRSVFVQLVVFASVGAAFNVLYGLLYLVLREQLSAQPANALALILSTIAGTFGHRYITFGVRGTDRTVQHQALGLALLGFSLAVTAGSLWLLDADCRRAVPPAGAGSPHRDQPGHGVGAVLPVPCGDGRPAGPGRCERARPGWSLRPPDLGLASTWTGTGNAEFLFDVEGDHLARGSS